MSGGGGEEHQDYLLQAEHLKLMGNDAYKNGDTHAAITYFSQAIDIDPDNHLLYSNRSAAYVKVDFISKALRDAEKCVLLQPTWIKGYNRLGIAQQLLARYDDAIDTFRRGLEIDPNDPSLWGAIRKCEEDKEKDKQFKIQEAIRQRELEDERKRISDENKRNIEKIKKEEAEAERLEAEEAAAVNAPAEEEDLLAGFFSEIHETEKEKQERGRAKELERQRAKEKEQELLKQQNEFFPIDEVASSGAAAALAKNDSATAAAESSDPPPLSDKYTSQDLGGGEEQVARLTGRHYEWRNLNPYYVLQLDTDATVEDIRYRYRKLSAKVHPDKLTTVDKAREAFEQVKNAYNRLLDGNQRTLITVHMENIRKDVQKERRKASSYPAAASDSTSNAGVPPSAIALSVEEDVRTRTMKLFADMEMERRRAEKILHSYSVHEKDLLQEEQERLKKEYEFQKDWTKEERVGQRVGNWRDFQQDPSAAKRPKTSHFIKEVNADGKRAPGAADEYKKAWR